MRSFLAALEICVVATCAIMTIAPYREPVGAMKDQARVETRVMVVAIAEPAVCGPASSSIKTMDRVVAELPAPTSIPVVPPVRMASLGMQPYASPAADEYLRRAPIEVVQPEAPNLLARARKYLGTNPTGWRSNWCAAFLAMLVPELAKKLDNPNWARDWAVLPKAKPRPGVIVVLSRGKGGHIGVLSRFDRRGNPVIVSGNHGHKVAESVYPKYRVLAYVSAGG